MARFAIEDPHDHTPIGTSGDTESPFRELTFTELTSQDNFGDYFRFSVTVRLKRDEALLLARKLEFFIQEATQRDCRVYLGVKNF
jgi:hypothetical protein